MPSRRRRWLVNIGFAILIAAALNVVLIATGQWGDTWFTEPIATLVVGTWLTFVYWVTAPSLVALLVLEGALRRPRTAPRATAILLGVTVAVVYMALLVLAFDYMPSIGIVLGLLELGAAGACFGALIRLPQVAKPTNDIGEH